MKLLRFFIPVLLLSTILFSGCTNDKMPAGGKNAEQSNYIGEEKAKDIALERAGLSASEVVFERTELDNDDGVWQYEVEFHKDRTEYSVEIKADDGTILSYEADYND